MTHVTCRLTAYDCQEPGSAPEPYARQSSMDYLFSADKLIQMHEKSTEQSTEPVSRKVLKLSGYRECLSIH